ncbi:hypothetical protein VP01_30g7 [Puccinia sorghi]|uniref:Uncharacterized protein n=1 Tax=Puccinia sorghi TaxID=27349 RepID=A0A0L6UZL1_9BASI|nr:hypothetical protein VP01_30g7 [Puccinia sorghi]
MCDPATYWGTTLFFVACYFSAGLAIIPTLWFIFHGHSAAASLGIWVTVADLVHAKILFSQVNSTVWRKDAINRSPIWCDISSQIILIYSTGSICSCVCIAKFLAFALSPSSRNISHEERQQINIRNYVFSLGFPIIMIPFHYLYSPSRFGLVRTMGCEASYVLTWPTFFFFIIWSPIFGMIAAGYTGKRFSGLHTCLYRAPCKKQNKGWIAYLITKMLLFLLAYVGYKLYQWKYTKTSPKNSTKLPVLRLAWLCITYTTAAVPLSIYYMVETLVRGNYSPFLVKKIRANSAGIEYESYKMKPTFYDVLPLMGSAIYIMFFTFSGELRTVYKNCFWRAYNFMSKINTTFRAKKDHLVETGHKLSVESHTQIQINVDGDTEMTPMQAQNTPSDLVTTIHTTSYPITPSPGTSEFPNARSSKTSSDQTLCSSPNALTALISNKI